MRRGGWNSFVREGQHDSVGVNLGAEPAGQHGMGGQKRGTHSCRGPMESVF